MYRKPAGSLCRAERDICVIVPNRHTNKFRNANPFYALGSAGELANSEWVKLATPAHIGGFIAGLVMQRPLLLWRYRGA